MQIRVQIKIHHVTLRLKQECEIQIAIKKGSQNILIPKTCKLVNCVAELYAEQEFYVPVEQAGFEIYVMLVYQSGRKLVGMTRIGLREYQQGVVNLLNLKLQKSPDSDSKINMQLLFSTVYDTQILNQHNPYIMQQQNCMQTMAAQILESNNSISASNQRLILQLQNLKKANNTLQNDCNDTNDNYKKCIASYQQRNHTAPTTNINQIGMKSESNNATQNQNKIKVMKEEQYVSLMEEKMVKLKQLVERCEGEDLREKVQDIFKMQ